jgi:hypothetical protein
MNAVVTRQHGVARHAAGSAATARTLADIARVRDLAESAERPDLVERLGRACPARR